MPEKTVWTLSRSRNIGTLKTRSQLPDWLQDVDPGLGPGAPRLISRVGSGTGSGRSSIWLNSEKIADVAPMPSASDRMAMKVTNGAFIRERMASLMLLMSPNAFSRHRDRTGASAAFGFFAFQRSRAC